jgi:hypothetical protein
MKPNVDEKVRLYSTILGVYGMLLGFLFIQGAIGILLGLVGLIALFTGLTGWFFIYHLMGKSTVPITTPEQEEEPNDVD